MLCGEASLASLSEDRKPRHLLDRVWDAEGVRYCLEQGQWQFAMRTQRIDYDPDLEPDFGYRRGFQKPSDWVLTSAVCSDEYFKVPLIQYADEQDYWYADLDEIYVKFVSDDNDYGNDLASWPASFSDYVYGYFASQIIFDLTSDKDKVVFLLGRDGKVDSGELGRRLKVAKSRAGMTQPSRQLPVGSWNRARYGNSGGDRGSNSNLIG